MTDTRSLLVLGMLVAACSAATEPRTDASAVGPGGASGAAQSITVAIQPKNVEVAPGGALAFVGNVYGTSDERLEWRTQPGGGAVDEAGHYVAPSAPGTYELTLTSVVDRGATAAASITVKDPAAGAAAPPPAIASFAAAPATVADGGETVLSWTVADATSVTIAPDVGEVAGGSVLVKPAATTAYTLSARNAGGVTTAVTTVTVVAGGAGGGLGAGSPVIERFAATPARVVAGQSTVLAWSVSGAGEISITPAAGTVTGGSVVVQPEATTTYTLTATSGAAVVTAQATVTVDPVPRDVPGTGRASVPRYVSATGGGATPSEAGAYVLTGAAGDGGTDDTEALQAALDAAAAAGKALLVPAPAAQYRISGKLHVATSIIGAAGAYPTIRMVGANGDGSHGIFEVRNYAGAGLVIAGLRLDGGFGGGAGRGSLPEQWRAPGGEYDSAIEVFDSRNITIRDNYLVNMFGDGVVAGTWADAGAGSSNVVVDGNLIQNTYRNAIFPQAVQDMVVTNNRMSNTFGYARIVDFEPNTSVEQELRIEVAYNVIDQYPATGWDGHACSRYAHAGLGAPGGHLYLHDNEPGTAYGFGAGFWHDAGGDWDDVLVVADNG